MAINLIRRLLQIQWVHRLLVAAGVRFVYRSIRNTILFLKYGNIKRITIEDLRVCYSTEDEASKRFFNDKYWFGDLFEKEITLHMITALRKSRCFIDVGANMGFYSILFAKLTEKHGGVSHAIEMDLENVGRMVKSIRLNNLTNVVTHHLAIGDHNGEVEYYRRGSELNTLMVTEKDRSHEKVTVQMRTMDEFVQENRLEPDAIKIDVEGAEFLVLSGMHDTLRKKDLKVYCEIHLHRGSGSLHAFGHSVEEVVAIFKEHGFLLKLLRLRSDSQYEERYIQSAAEITESCMLFASREA